MAPNMGEGGLPKAAAARPMLEAFRSICTLSAEIFDGQCMRAEKTGMLAFL